MSEEIHEIKAMLRSAFERSPEFPTITAASLRGKRCGSRPVQRHFNRWRPRISPSRLLLRVANVDGRLLGLLPHERARYLALGALILADGMLTAGAIGLGISQAGIPTPLSILLIIGISLVCVLLTRYCSTSNRGSKWWLILPRLVMACAFALIISNVLATAFFAHEIQVEAEQGLAESRSMASESVSRGPLAQQIEIIRAELDAAQYAATAADVTESQREAARERVASLQTHLDAVTDQFLSQQESAIRAVRADTGFLADLQNLDRARSTDPVVNTQFWTLCLLVCGLGIMPLLIGFGARNDTYHRLIAIEESYVAREVQLRVRAEAALLVGRGLDAGRVTEVTDAVSNRISEEFKVAKEETLGDVVDIELGLRRLRG